MIELPIDYIPTRRGQVLLLDEDSRARLEATVADLKQKEAIFRDAKYDADAVQIRLALAGPENQLRADRELRESHASEIRTAVIVFNEPSQADVDDLREIALKEGEDPHLNLKIRRAAFDQLAPKVTSGHPTGDGREDVPVKFRSIVEGACRDACFADLSEELVNFTTRSPQP